MRTELGEERWTRDMEQVSQGGPAWGSPALGGLQDQCWRSVCSLCFFSAPAQRSAQGPWTTAVDFTTTRSVHSGDSAPLCLPETVTPQEAADPSFSSPGLSMGKPQGLDPPRYPPGKVWWGEGGGEG